MIACFRGGYVLSNKNYTGGNGPMWLDDVICSGSEETILDCTHSPIESHDCTHTEDVAIQCMPGMYERNLNNNGNETVVCDKEIKLRVL